MTQQRQTQHPATQRFEFVCIHGRYRIQGAAVQRCEGGRWVGIDRGDPDKIGRQTLAQDAKEKRL